MQELTVALWNLEWATANSRRGLMIRHLLNKANADLICLTEAYANFLTGGYSITSIEDYGYPITVGRRKVLLWSRTPWRDADHHGSPDLPPGRFVGGTVTAPFGPLRVLGVCIPWRDAHVRSGRRDAIPWSEHVEYIRALAPLLEASGSPAIILGDFNQRVPPQRQPPTVAEALQECIGAQFHIASAGVSDANGRSAIDHLACTDDIKCELVSILPANHEGIALSDHFGMILRLWTE